MRRKLATAILAAIAIVAAHGASAWQSPEGKLSGASGFIGAVGANLASILTQTTLSSDTKDELLRTTLEESINFQSLAQAIIGHRWNLLTQNQRARFEALLQAHVLNRYTRLLNEHVPDRFDVIDEYALGQKGAAVRTSVKRQDTELTQIDWVVTDAEGRFQVIDLLINQISLIRTYRSEFSSVIDRFGIDALLTALEAKVIDNR